MASAQAEAEHQVWERLYRSGERLDAQGTSISAELRRLRFHDADLTLLSFDDLQLFFEYRAAVALTQRYFRELSDAAIVQYTDGGAMQLQLANLLDIRHRVAVIRMLDAGIGSRDFVRSTCRRLGITGAILQMVDSQEEHLGELNEQYKDALQELGRFAHNFQTHIETGGYATVGGYLRAHNLINVGPPTLVADIASTVSDLAAHTDQNCSVCFEDILLTHIPTGLQAVRTKCGHLYHSTCLSNWANSLAEQCNTCPLCRTELFTRRPREINSDLEKYDHLCDICWTLRESIEKLRQYNNMTASLLLELEPERVAHSLGR